MSHLLEKKFDKCYASNFWVSFFYICLSWLWDPMAAVFQPIVRFQRQKIPQQNGRSGMAPHVFQHPGVSKPNFLRPTQWQADQQCTNTNAYIVLNFARPRHDGCLVSIFSYPSIPAMDFVPRWTRKEKTWKNTSNNTFLSQTCLEAGLCVNCQVLARERQARHTSLSCQRHFGPLGRWRQVFCHPVGGPAIQDKGVSTRVLRRCGSCVVSGPKQPVIKCCSLLCRHGRWVKVWWLLRAAVCCHPGDGCSWSCGRCAFSWEMVFSNLFMFKRFWTTWTRTESSLMGVRCGYPVVFPTSFPCLARITFPHFSIKIETQPNQT